MKVIEHAEKQLDQLRKDDPRRWHWVVYLEGAMDQLEECKHEMGVAIHNAEWDGFKCTRCGGDYMDVADGDAYESGWKPDYCPHCGAKMGKKEDAK